MKITHFSRGPIAISVAITVVISVLLAFAGSTQAQLTPSDSSSRPAPTGMLHRTSIIFIQCDGLGYGDFSCYGQTNFQTPNFDKLAAGGIRFDHYTPGDTNQAVAQAALLTGTSSGEGTESVAELLKSAGYRTGLIGEWQAPGKPWEKGFDQFLGLMNPESVNYYAPTIWRHTPAAFYNETNKMWMPWKPEYGPNYGGNEIIFENMYGKQGKYLPDLMLGAIVKNFIRVSQPDKFNGFQPLFLMVNLPAPRTATAGKDDFPVPTDAPYSDEPWPQAAKNRAAIITRLDNEIGYLLKDLDQYKMTNNVVIFLSSSAEPEKFANSGLKFFHTPADLKNEGKKDWSAPMIVYWPGLPTAGKTSDFKWSAKDFLPTAAQIGDGRTPKDIEGHSILPILLGQATEAVP